MSDICPITHEPLTNPTKLPCGHEFDTDAINEWCEVSDTCPICRAPTERVTISNATTIRQEMQEIMNERRRLDRRARELEFALMQRQLDTRPLDDASTPTMHRDMPRPSRYKRFRAALDSAGEAIMCRLLRWGIRTFT